MHLGKVHINLVNSKEDLNIYYKVTAIQPKQVLASALATGGRNQHNRKYLHNIINQRLVSEGGCECVVILPTFQGIGNFPIPSQARPLLRILTLAGADCVGEVAPEPVWATVLLPKCITWFCFIGVLVHIAPQFLHAMGKLALISVGAVPFFRVVSAQGALHLILAHIPPPGLESIVLQYMVIIPIGRSFGNGIRSHTLIDTQQYTRHFIDNVMYILFFVLYLIIISRRLSWQINPGMINTDKKFYARNTPSPNKTHPRPQHSRLWPNLSKQSFILSLSMFQQVLDLFLRLSYFPIFKPPHAQLKSIGEFLMAVFVIPEEEADRMSTTYLNPRFSQHNHDSFRHLIDAQ